MRRFPKDAFAVRLGLVLLGTACALLLVELGLRAGGAVLRNAGRGGGGAPGSVVVLCLGESTTAVTWPKDHSWPRQLAALMNAPGSSRRYDVVNAAAIGTNSQEILAGLPQLLAARKPDVVVAMLGVNDTRWYGVDAPSRAPRALRGLKIYKLLRYFKHEILRPDAPADSEPGSTAARDGVVRLIRKSGVPLILMQYPGLDAGLLEERYDGPGVWVVDNKSRFDAALAEGRYEDYYVDHFGGRWGHCTAKGDALIAQNAARALMRLLGENAEEPPPAAFNASASASRDVSLQDRLIAARENARRRFQQGDEAGAEAALKAALAYAPRDSESLQMLRELKRDAPDPSPPPDSSSARRANLFLELARRENTPREEALSYCGQAARAAAQEPLSQRILIYRECAFVRQRWGDAAGEAALLRRVLAADPRDLEALNLLAQLAPSGAREALVLLLKTLPAAAPIKARWLVLRALARAGAGAPAYDDELRQAVAASPRAACLEAPAHPARSRLSLGYFDLCLRAFPREAVLYHDRGVARYLRGQKDAAADDFRKALALKPDYPHASLSWASLLAEQGDGAGARDVARKALASAKSKAGPVYEQLRALSRRP